MSSRKPPLTPADHIARAITELLERSTGLGLSFIDWLCEEAGWDR